MNKIGGRGKLILQCSINLYTDPLQFRASVSF
jgi:hypothetical protein